MRAKPRTFAQFFPVGFLLAGVAVGGAYGQEQETAKEPPPPAIAKLSAAVPSLTALKVTPLSQTKGGLEITLASEAFAAKESWTTRKRRITPPPGMAVVVKVNGKPDPNVVCVEAAQIPALTVSPDHLVFHLHIENWTARTFRASGIGVQFQVAGREVPVDASSYSELTRLEVAPGGEREVAIAGPAIAAIPVPSTVGLSLVGVATEMAPSGNATEKQRFEWQFSYKTKAVKKTVEVPPPTTDWVVAN